jgi:hypothetical protein
MSVPSGKKVPQIFDIGESKRGQWKIQKGQVILMTHQHGPVPELWVGFPLADVRSATGEPLVA